MGISVLFSSCKKDSTTASEEYGANSTGTFTGTIGGKQWQATKVRAYVQDIYTRFSGTGTISDTSCKFSAVSVYIDVKYFKKAAELEIGVSKTPYTFDASAYMECTLRKDGSVVTYTGQYVNQDNFSILKITTYSSAKLEGTVEFRSVYEAASDTVDLRSGAFSITF
jgi:hypothetical protein